MKETFILLALLGVILATQPFLPQESLEPQSSGKIYRIPLKTQRRNTNRESELFNFIAKSQSILTDSSFAETKSGYEKIHMSNFKNLQYTAEIAIGKQFETYKVVLDTGSANMWIDSKKCSDEGCEKHHQYDSSQSQSYQKIGENLEVDFGTGSLKGEINADTIYFGDLALPSQNFAEIVQENGMIFRELDFDGILGLAYPQMAADNMNPVFDNLMQQNKLEKNMFSFYLTKDEQGLQSSVFTLGGYESKLIDGEINWHNVVDQYYWTVEADNILVDGKDVGFCKHGCKVIADTGTSIMTAPIDDLSALLKMLKVRDHCKELDKLPDITYILNGVHYTLTPEEYVKQTNPDQQSLSQIKPGDDINMFVETTNWDCIASFMPMDIQEPQGPAWILGDVFLTKYYSIYDRDNNRVGFGKAI